jgi:hypothetical protein
MCLVVGTGCLGVACRLHWVGAFGIEDVPPPFTLLAGLAGIGLLGVAPGVVLSQQAIEIT